ncbi:c-type cytochrome [Salipiger mucosus]|uniref:Putative cytochrome c-552 n=1 Tax=Salipiger mucosus DSM 16094 TaxID=1123237 RepID=S9Q717_9RHOB|nr:c-type cytochrome [Salipiger mucosus]EPX75832.1 putative cytochrome c-552 [Salipiger mucosus DSM 16094]
MRRYILGALAAVALAGGAFYFVAPYNIAASVPHLPGVANVLHGYLGNAVAVRARSVEIPPHVDLENPGLIRLGAGHFATGCLTCHGGPGIDRNPVAQGMRPAPPKLTSEDFDAKEFWWIARHGFKYTGMPAWPGKSRDDEPWAMAAFLARYDSFDRAGFEEAAFGRAGVYEPEGVPFGAAPAPIPQEVTCARCHGEDGLGRDGTAPKLAGQSGAWLARVLGAYSAGHRESGFMEPVAAPLGDEAIGRIAARYAGMDATWRGTPFPLGDAERGEELATQGSEHDDIASCVSCHGSGAEGPKRDDTPKIAGQDGYWLVNWLHMYRDGPVPETPRAHLMAAAARTLSDSDIHDLAAYFSRGP